MTLDTPPAAPCTPVSPRSPGELRDSGDTVVHHRERPIVHPAVDPPLCEDCLKAEMSFFDPNCPGCIDLLSNETTTSPEIFAILRQWTPQTQQNLEILIREVLKRGANVNDHDGQTDMTLLMYVAKAGAHGVGDVDEACRMATLLLSRGADVFTRCRWTNMTPSHYATYFDVAPVLKILLKASRAIDVDSLCSEFDHGSPLHIAAANLAYESGKVLLNNGANPHIKDDLGRLPIDCVPDPAEFEVNSDMAKLCAKVRRMFMEAEEQQANEKAGGASEQVLAALGINVGEKVMVGGVKSGILRFCGPTEFASGMWAGIELDEAAGKNDGSVGSISYFKCPPKYGIFAPISKISKAGILVSGGRQTSSPGGTSSRSSLNFPKVNTSHVTSRIDTGLSRLGGGRGSSSHPDELMEVGERVIVAGQRRGVVKYSGEADFAPGWWYGVELDRPVGKNDGSVNGKRFFTCKPKFGVFAPPSRVQRIPSHGDSRDSLDSLSATATDRQRRLSGSAGSQQSLNSSSSKKAATRTPSKNLRTIAEKTTNNRPKSSGTLAMWRTPPAVAAGGEMKLQEGMSVFCNNELGVLRYIGEVDFAEGLWLGVELRTPKGKNDGSVQGRRYFMCRPLHGLLVRPSKVTIRGINGAKLLGESAEADGSK